VITISKSIKQKGSGGMSETIIRKMSEVELQEARWLWKPYIPFGKLSIIQGDSGEGKTTFALRLAAACSSGVALPGMETTEPFNVIYQTAEDGLGDTIKPRLIEAGADENMVLNIIEDTDATFDGENMIDIGKPPILAEVIDANVRLKTVHGTKMKVWGVNAEGFYSGQMAATYDEEGYLNFRIGDGNAACYYLIVKE